MLAAVLIVLAAGWAVTACALIRFAQSQQRAHARREDLLLNQLLHAVGTPWQPAPADTGPDPEPRETWVNPEQEPVFE